MIVRKRRRIPPASESVSWMMKPACLVKGKLIEVKFNERLNFYSRNSHWNGRRNEIWWVRFCIYYFVVCVRESIHEFFCFLGKMEIESSRKTGKC